MKRYLFIVLFSLSIVFIISGCDQVNTVDFKEVIRVSVILPEQNDAYWSVIKNGILAEIELYDDNVNADYKILSPFVNYNISQMTDILKQQIAAKVDVLVVQGNDDEIFIEHLNKALKSGIKVICVDTDAPDLKNHLYIGTDNMAAGRLMAEKTVSMCGRKASITVISGDENSLNQKQRYNGFQDVIGKYPEIDIISREYDYYDGITFMDLFYKNDDSNVMICLEGTGAKVLGSVNLEKESPYECILGFDHTQAIYSGVVDGVIEQDMGGMGRKIVEIIAKYCQTGFFPDGKIYTDISFVTATDVTENE